ncbi:MAG: carboxymuconolactone decarboxylase family protein [Chloroflexi bacterium]|nr:carboxymuconolactone decarboxylase family protein [Chloroflexota bacterium]
MEDTERSELFKRGIEQQRRTWGERYYRPSLYEQVDPDLHRIVVEFVHGEILSRPGLDAKTRELLILVMLTVLGRAREVETRIHCALNVGWTRQEITEAIIQSAIYAGFPLMHSALTLAKKVFEEREA